MTENQNKDLEKAVSDQEGILHRRAKGELDEENRKKNNAGQEYPGTFAEYHKALKIKQEEVVRRN